MPETMIVSFRGEVAKIEIPDQENMQMVSLLVTGPDVDIFLDGAPVDPETGERMLVIEKAPDAVVKAADEIVKAFHEGEWKIGSESFKSLQRAVKGYEYAKLDAQDNDKPEPTEDDRELLGTAPVDEAAQSGQQPPVS